MYWFQAIHKISFKKKEEGSSSSTDTTEWIESSNEAMPSATEVLNEASQSKGYGQIKSKTFYGGQVIKDPKTLNLGESTAKKASFRLNPSCPSPSLTRVGEASPTTIATTHFEFIGACVKLGKSSLTSGRKGDTKAVNFSQVPETFEYPSYEFLLKEMGIDPQTDPDYQMVPEASLSFDNFLPGLSSPASSSSSAGHVYYDNHATSDFYSASSDDINISVTKFTKSKSEYHESVHMKVKYKTN